MKTFQMIGTVRRTVTDTIDLTVLAKSEAEAHRKAYKVLSIFPEEHPVQGVPNCRLFTREQNSIEVLDLVEQPENSVA